MSVKFEYLTNSVILKNPLLSNNMTIMSGVSSRMNMLGSLFTFKKTPMPKKLLLNFIELSCGEIETFKQFIRDFSGKEIIYHHVNAIYTGYINTNPLQFTVGMDKESFTIEFLVTGINPSPSPSPSPELPILDILATAAFEAWSFQLLRAAYTGNCLRARRSADDAESDFGFVDGWFDEASYIAWLGASTGYCVTLYSQFGLNDLTQSTAANQPTILLDQVNGHPALRFTGGDKYLRYLDWTTTPSFPYTFINMINIVFATSEKTMYRGTAAGKHHGALRLQDATGKPQIYNHNAYCPHSDAVDNTWQHIESDYDGTGSNKSRIRHKGSDTIGTIGSLEATWYSFYLGSISSGAEFDWAELIMFDSLVATNDLTLLRTRATSTYGIVSP